MMAFMSKSHEFTEIVGLNHLAVLLASVAVENAWR